MYASNDSGRTFAWQDISTDVTSSLRQQMKTLNVSGEAKVHTADKDGDNIGPQSEDFVSSSSVKNKVHGMEVLLLTMAVEMEKGMEARRVQKYEELKLHLNQNEKAPARENGRAKLPTKNASKRSIRNETLRANERRKIHQIETEKLRSRKRKKIVAQLLRRLGDTPEKWKPSVSSVLDKKVESLICEARLHDLSIAEDMAILLHQKKQLREQYFTAKRNEREAKQNVLEEARNERKELLFLARLYRRGAKKKINSAKKASEERVRRLLSRDLVNRQWQEIQHTAYNINFTRPCTFSYFQPKKRARRVTTA